jgi:hypothetical protein
LRTKHSKAMNEMKQESSVSLKVYSLNVKILIHGLRPHQKIHTHVEE